MQAPLVTFEGIDGTGKSTVLGRVAEALHASGLDAVATREETGTKRGAWVREAIQDRLDPLATTFLFLADRAAHVQEIQQWRRQGRPVLCDRFLHSTLAYQGVTLADRMADPEGFLRRLHEPWCPMPDPVLLFVGDPAACVARTRRRGGNSSNYEKEGFLARVQERYRALAAAEPERFRILDAEQGLDLLTEEATRIVQGHLASRRAARQPDA